MKVLRLAVSSLRGFTSAEMAPGPGFNLISGDNGAGKTTLLEAMHVMAYGRSFRGRVRDGLVRGGDEALEIFVEWEEGEARLNRKAGLRHTGSQWTGRLDGEDVGYLGELCAALAVVSFEPGSHELISGNSEGRRRFIDWGLFHVEPDFLALWRRYSRALKQRNALLKTGASPASLNAWDQELADAGEPLTRRRLDYIDRLATEMVATASALAPGLRVTGIEFNPGWKRQEMPLSDALLLARDRDRTQGFTTVGPHRADWRLGYGQIAGRDQLSRGQAKLSALAALLAQAADYAERRGEWPVVSMDDLGSELDQGHRERAIALLSSTGAQVFVTATEASGASPETHDARLFHVEHGRVERVLPGTLPI